MAASKRRTTKKNIGQTLNDVDRRLKSVEFRANYRTVGSAAVEGSSITNDSITLEKLDPELRRILIKLKTDVEVSNSTVLPAIADLQDYNVSISSFAQESADGKNAIFYQAEPPDPDDRQVGDIWFDTDNDYKPSKFDGNDWVDASFGDGAISYLDVGKLTTGVLRVGMQMTVGAQAIGDQAFYTRLSAMSQSALSAPFQQNTDTFEMRMVDSVNSIAPDGSKGYYSRLAMSMIWNGVDTSMNPVLRLQRRNVVPTLTNVPNRNESNLVGSFADQEIAIWTMTPFNSRYSPYLRGLPSISFDDPGGYPAGQIGSYDLRRFGLEATSGKAYATITDVSSSQRSVNLYAAGNTSNARVASMILSGYYGEIIVDEGIFSPLPLMCRLYSTADTAVSPDNYSAINFNTFQFPATTASNFFYPHCVFEKGNRLSGTTNNTTGTSNIPVITIPKSGYYRVSGQVRFVDGTGKRYVIVRAISSTSKTGITNGNGTAVSVVTGTASAGPTTLTYDGVLALSQGTNICVWASSSDGADVLAASASTYICIEYLGRAVDYDIAV